MKNFPYIKKSFLLIKLVITFSVLTSCVTTKTAIYQEEKFKTPGNKPLTKEYSFTLSPEELGICPPSFDWTPISSGFDYLTYKISSLKVSWTCVRIDLHTQNLQVSVTPDNKSKLGKTFYLTEFAKETKSTVAINTTPFDIEKFTYHPIGITISEKQIISPVSDSYCALTLTKTPENTLQAKILQQKDMDTTKYDYAIGGFFIIYQNKKSIPFSKIRRSRNGCGLSEDGRYLYLITVTPDFSLDDMNGLNYEECAYIFQQLECSIAMQFDGGHSTGMCIQNKQIQFPLFQRKIPAAMGFKIKD